MCSNCGACLDNECFPCDECGESECECVCDEDEDEDEE
jgi:hypothetical protein